MSAFMVSKRHIDNMVWLLTTKRVSRVSEREVNEGLAIEDVVGRRLVDENRASINAKYPDTRGNVEGEPGSGDVDPGTYFYAVPRRFPTTVQALKLVTCYEYQSCEHPEWGTSWAKQVCRDLRMVLIASLPGYSEAAWEAE